MDFLSAHFHEFSPLVIVYGMLVIALVLTKLLLSLRKSDTYTVTASDGRTVDIKVDTTKPKPERAALLHKVLQDLEIQIAEEKHPEAPHLNVAGDASGSRGPYAATVETPKEPYFMDVAQEIEVRSHAPSAASSTAPAEPIVRHPAS